MKCNNSLIIIHYLFNVLYVYIYIFYFLVKRVMCLNCFNFTEAFIKINYLTRKNDMHWLWRYVS